MKCLTKILVVVAVIMSLVVPAQAASGIDIGKDLGKLPKDIVPAIELECVVLTGYCATVNKTSGEISLKRKYVSTETQTFMLVPVSGRAGYYTLAVITDYGNWLYLNHPARGQYPNVVPGAFNNGVRTIPDSATWRLQWKTIQTGGRPVTGWTLANAKTKWIFSTSGWATWRIRVLNNSSIG